MILIVIAALFVLGIALFQGIQGLFSALIMSILTILCAALAFNFYEPLAEALLYTRQPATADAIMLVAMFVVPLLVLRICCDKFLGRNVVLNVWVSRIGGGFLGLITGMVVVGVLAVAVQMLPTTESFMYYRPYDGSLKRVQRLAPFYPDEFAVGLVNLLSGGGLSGGADTRFQSTHDDLFLELFCARNTAGKHGRVDARPDSLNLIGVYDPDDAKVGWANAVPPNPLLPKNAIPNIVIARLSIDRKAQDEDRWWRLVATHFRMVTEAGKSYYPVGYLSHGPEGWQVHSPQYKENQPQIAELIVQRPLDAEKSPRVTVDWIYRIPSDEDPAGVSFRRVAVERVGKVKKNALPPTKGALDLAFKPDKKRASRQRRR